MGNPSYNTRKIPKRGVANEKMALVLAGILAVAGIAAGCGGQTTDNKSAGGDKKVVLKVGATPVPHAEILNEIKPMLAKEGVDLQVVEFTDYVKPNLSLHDKEIDANFMQHEPYLNKINEERNLGLVSVGKVHIEPMGVYSKKVKDIKNVPDNASVAIPNRSYQRRQSSGHFGKGWSAEAERRCRRYGYSGGYCGKSQEPENHRSGSCYAAAYPG